MRATLLLLAAILLAPSALACSLAGPVPGPGAFTLWPHDGGAPIEIPVHGRSLGGMCELSNRHVLVDGVFAWIEHPERSRGTASAHLRDLASGEERVLDLGVPNVEAFTLWEGHVVTYSVSYDDPVAPEGTHHFLLHDVDDGSVDEIAFPEGRWTSVALGGRHIAASLRTNGYEGPDLFYLYDLETARFVLEEEPAREIVGDDILWVAAVDDTWLIAGGREGGRVLYEIATGQAHDAPRSLSQAPGGVTLSKEHAYVWRFGTNGMEAVRVGLPGGASESLPPVKGTIVGAVPEYTIVGEYSAGDGITAPHEREITGSGIGRAFALIGWLLAALLGALFR